MSYTKTTNILFLGFSHDIGYHHQTKIASALIIGVGTALVACGGKKLNANCSTSRMIQPTCTKEFNPEFIKWQGKTGEHISIEQSHGGGGKQTEPSLMD